MLPLINDDFEDGARSRHHSIVDTLTAAMELSILSRLYRGACNEEDEQFFLSRVIFSRPLCIFQKNHIKSMVRIELSIQLCCAYSTWLVFSMSRNNSSGMTAIRLP